MIIQRVLQVQVAVEKWLWNSTVKRVTPTIRSWCRVIDMCTPAKGKLMSEEVTPLHHLFWDNLHQLESTIILMVTK